MNFGEQSDEPEAYWRPFLGVHFSLRPCDMADLTPLKMIACLDYLGMD